MKNYTQIQRQAIQAAKELDWEKAVKLNQTIVTNKPDDINALNRLANAHMQLDNIEKAEEFYEEVIKIDKSNVIAKKNLNKIKNGSVTKIKSFHNNFIEEPGKSKTIQLHRLTNKDKLHNISAGQKCILKSKNRFISIKVEDEYVGALPEDISFRLTKLINNGNEYSCHINSCGDKHCSVFISEEKQDDQNFDQTSFAIKKI